MLRDKDLVAATRNGPDVLGRWRILRDQGFEAEQWPAAPLPWNPFAAKATALRGLDPLRTVKVLFCQQRYGIIACVFEASAVGPAILKRLGLLRRPLLLWDFSADTQWRLKRLFQRIILPVADGILCLNRPQMEIAESIFGANGKTAFVGYEVDTEFFHPRYSNDGSYVLAVGDDVSRDYPLVIEAASQLPITLTLCTRRSVETAAEAIARVNHIQRYLSYSELRAMYGQAKFVVLPLKDMPHPGGITTLVEAMSMGKAIICSSSSGIREFLEPGENAIVVAPGDCGALRTAIDHLNSDDEERRRLGQNARKYAEEVFGAHAAAQRLLDALKRFA